MTIGTAACVVDRLREELGRFDWSSARATCAKIVDQVWKQRGWLSDQLATTVLRELRAKRQFAMLERIAETLILTGMSQPVVRRQLAQAFLDQGSYAAAQAVLRGILDQRDVTDEHAEAQGLLGRLYKQLYVNPGRGRSAGEARFLWRALSEYRQAYDANPVEHYWHGINVAALLARAERDHLPLPSGVPDVASVATQILSSLDWLAQKRAAGEQGQAFELATRVEALVALRDFRQALTVAAQYVAHPNADAFELASTERQLREVWQLDPDPDPHSGQLLSLLRAILLSKQGGKITLVQDTVGEELDAATKIAASAHLEAILGTDKFQTLTWYRHGLECCAGVVRIETRSARGFGTGWIVDGGDLSDRWEGKTVVVTNKHVVCPPMPNGAAYEPEPGRRALRPSEAVIFHEISGTRWPAGVTVLWTSPDLSLDATVLELPNVPKEASKLKLSKTPVAMTEPPDRVYIIGHPDGRGLEFSLHDNVMLACNATKLHYRAPTEGGSSGSPVFDAEWNVVALHHAGGRDVTKLQGVGRYDANEGILTAAILAAGFTP